MGVVCYGTAYYMAAEEVRAAYGEASDRGEHSEIRFLNPGEAWSIILIIIIAIVMIIVIIVIVVIIH